MTKNKSLFAILFLSILMILIGCEEYDDELYDDDFDEDGGLDARAAGP